MTDRTNPPIRIPIRFADAEDVRRGVEPDDSDEDVIEIDGDAIDLDADKAAASAESEEDAGRVKASPRAVERAADRPAVAPRPGTDSGPLTSSAADGPELSVEAFAELGRELRQKS